MYPETVSKIENKLLASFIGEIVILFSENYTYKGKLESVEYSIIKLSSAKLITPHGLDLMTLYGELYIDLSMVESYMLKKEF